MADTKFDYKAEGLKSLYAAAGAYDLAFETAKKLATEQVAELKTLVADLQKKVSEFDFDAKGVQADVKAKLADLQKKVTEFEFDAKKLQEQATSLVNARVEALTKEAKELQGKVESLVSDLTNDAKSFPAKVQAEVLPQIKGLPAKSQARFESLLADVKGYPTKAQTYVTTKVNATVSDVNGQYAEFASRGEKAVAALRRSGAKAEAVVDAPVDQPVAKKAPAKKAAAKKAPAKKAAANEAAANEA
jgi:heparin binding hemagglutinin HbhA